MFFNPYLIGICKSCYSNPVFIKKRGLCRSCYNKDYKRGKIKRLEGHYPHPREWKIERLKKKYGEDLINDLILIKKHASMTLTEIGDKYGFSREYARQTFKIVNGVPYTKYLKIKADKYNDSLEEIGCSEDPRHKVAEYTGGTSLKGAKAELLCFNKCEGLGFDVSAPCNKTVDLLVNGFRVDVKSAWGTNSMGSSVAEYYCFLASKKQQEICDFLACYAQPIDTFYIIPKLVFGCGTIYIRANNNRGRTDYTPKRKDYRPFKEAWYLLNDGYTGGIPIVPAKKMCLTLEEVKQKRHDYYIKNQDKLKRKRALRYQQPTRPAPHKAHSGRSDRARTVATANSASPYNPTSTLQPVNTGRITQQPITI